MDSAKASVKKFMGKSGQHDTTVHEKVAPAVQHETISQKQHDRTIPAVDREIHQDHYHTTEQPISHSEVLPEQHHHKAAPVEHRSFEHDDADRVKRGIADEQAQYQDKQMRVDGERTQSTEATVTGEHKHHHVHENIQPIVQKQTVEPHVVHTTVPVHEVHHNTTQHHSASALPPVSMDEFKKQGGTLEGRGEHRDHFPGEPKHVGADSGATGHSNGVGLDGHGTRPKQSDIDPADVRTTPTNTTSSSTTAPSTTSTTHKPSLMDKINPKKDADGDGKPGFMK